MYYYQLYKPIFVFCLLKCSHVQLSKACTMHLHDCWFIYSRVLLLTGVHEEKAKTNGGALGWQKYIHLSESISAWVHETDGDKCIIVLISMQLRGVGMSAALVFNEISCFRNSVCSSGSSVKQLAARTLLLYFISVYACICSVDKSSGDFEIILCYILYQFMHAYAALINHSLRWDLNVKHQVVR